jgi:hypothetical protein
VFDPVVEGGGVSSEPPASAPAAPAAPAASTLWERLEGPARGFPSDKTEGCVGGDRALPCIRPRSHDPVEDSERRDRLDRFGMGMGRLEEGGLGLGLEERRTCEVEEDEDIGAGSESGGGRGSSRGGCGGG